MTCLGLESTSLVWAVNTDQTDCSPNGLVTNRLTSGCGVWRVGSFCICASDMSVVSSNMFGCAHVAFNFRVLRVFCGHVFSVLSFPENDFQLVGKSF